MTASDTPVRAVEPGTSWHRLSPRMLLVHPVIELGRALPLIVGLVFAGGDHSNPVPSLVVVALVTVLALARWFTTQLRITDEQVELKQGLIRRRSLATRRDRIRTVDVTSHLLHRALGLSRVVVGTGTSDRKGRDRLVLDGLTAADAGRLRDELLRGRAGTPGADHHVADAGPIPVLARLDARWVGFAPFTLSGVVTGLVVWGFFWRLQGDGVDVLHSGPLRAVTHEAERMSTAAVVVAVVVVLVAFVAVTSLLGYVLAFWNFRLVRHPGGTLEVTRGLLTTRSTSIERRRLVGVRVSEPLLLRAVGGARLLAVATGLRVGRGAEKGGEVLLPPAPVAAARAVAEQVLATGTSSTGRAVTAVLQPHGRRATRRRYARALACGALLVAAALAGWWTGGSFWAVPVALVLLVACVPLAADRASALGHAHVEGALVTRYGSLIRRRVVLADDAVIGWTMRATWFQRRVGLSTLTATTAAGRQSYRVVDLDTRTAVLLADTVTAGLLTPFQAPPAPAHPAHRARAQ